jgi:hypothetical protein
MKLLIVVGVLLMPAVVSSENLDLTPVEWDYGDAQVGEQVGGRPCHKLTREVSRLPSNQNREFRHVHDCSSLFRRPSPARSNGN